MNIVIDPDVPGDDLRQQLYAGNLVILTRLQALKDFVEYTRDELTELFEPYDPEHVHEHIDPAEMAKILGVWKPRFIHSDRSKKLVRAIIAGGRVPGRGHPLRPAQAADVLPCGAPYHRCRLRLPVASRHLVQRARPADQLVAARLPGARGQRHEL